MKSANLVILICIGLTMLSQQTEQQEKVTETAEAEADGGQDKTNTSSTSVEDGANANNNTNVDNNKDEESHSVSSEGNVNNPTEAPKEVTTGAKKAPNVGKETDDQEEDSEMYQTVYGLFDRMRHIDREKHLPMYPVLQKYQESLKVVIDALNNENYKFLGIVPNKNNNPKPT